MRSDDGERLQHVVADFARHFGPSVVHRHAVEARRRVLPSMGAHHALVAARGGVERNLPLDARLFRLDFFLRRAGDDEAAGVDFDFVQRTPRAVGAYLQVGDYHLAGVFRRAESVQQNAVAHLARHAQHVRVDRRDEHLYVGVRDGAGVEERRHQVEVVVVAVELDRRPRLPSVPDVAERLNVLAHARRGRGPIHAEPPHNVSADLAAEPQREPAAGQRLKVPGDIRHVHRAARERQRDGRPQPHALRMLRRDGQRQKRVVVRLRRAVGVEPDPLRPPRRLRDFRRRRARQSRSYFHCETSPDACQLKSARTSADRRRKPSIWAMRQKRFASVSALAQWRRIALRTNWSGAPP